MNLNLNFIFNFFQNVLRELEQKKPQLDDLVKTAENLRESPIRQQIPEKGKKRNKNIIIFKNLLTLRRYGEAKFLIF